MHHRHGAQVSPSESATQASIRLRLGSEKGLVLWRNNVVQAKEWNPVNGEVRHIHGGLPKGSSDLIGIVQVPAHFGILPKTIGRFISLEVKTETGRTTPEQEQWMALVRSHGGFACVVRSADEAEAAVRRCIEGKSQ